MTGTSTLTQDSCYRRDNKEQIQKVRTYIREAKYFDNLFENTTHVSLDGKTILNEELVCFEEKAKLNLESYVTHRQTNRNPILKAIPITMEAYNNTNAFENLTKEEMKIKIYEILKCLDSDTSANQEERFKSSIKNCSKEAYIEFYYTLLEIVDEDTQETEPSDELDDHLTEM